MSAPSAPEIPVTLDGKTHWKIYDLPDARIPDRKLIIGKNPAKELDDTIQTLSHITSPEDLSTLGCASYIEQGEHGTVYRIGDFAVKVYTNPYTRVGHQPIAALRANQTIHAGLAALGLAKCRLDLKTSYANKQFFAAAPAQRAVITSPDSHIGDMIVMDFVEGSSNQAMYTSFYKPHRRIIVNALNELGVDYRAFCFDDGSQNTLFANDPNDPDTTKMYKIDAALDPSQPGIAERYCNSIFP